VKSLTSRNTSRRSLLKAVALSGAAAFPPTLFSEALPAAAPQGENDRECELRKSVKRFFASNSLSTLKA